MAINENLIPIPGRLHSVASEGHVAGADEVFDDDLKKTQKELNDPNSQNVIDATDYIELRDSNKIPHKILAADFYNACISAFGIILSSISKGTDISKLLVIDSNGEIGGSTVQNLLDLLNVFKGIGDGSAQGLDRDFDKLTKTGMYYTNTWDGNWSNSPEMATTITIVFSYNGKAGQFFLKADQVVYRYYDGSSWGVWKNMINT